MQLYKRCGSKPYILGITAIELWEAIQVIVYERGRRDARMWNEPTEVQLLRIPRLYETDDVSGLDKLIRMHFFIGGSDWYAAEYCPRERNFFGYAILNNDLECSEWGYFNLDEMRAIKIPPGIEIDRDLHWDVRPAAQVDKIKQAYEWKGH